MSAEQMRILIAEYLAAVEGAADLLRRRCGQRDLLRAWRSGVLPKEGWLDREGGSRYSFHGLGCTIERGEEIINFDFGPEGRVDGFDLWRLQQFLTCRQAQYSDLSTVEEQKESFSQLIHNGEVVRYGEPPSSHLFRLRSGDDATV